MKVPARPYAKIRGTEPSVTTLVGLLDKPGLRWAAVNETATFVLHHPEKWQTRPYDEAHRTLRQHHDGIWKGRAAFGTLCHAVAEAYAAGREVDIEALVDEAMETNRDARTWREIGRDTVIETALGFVLGIEKWWDTFQPKVICAETVVRTPGAYIGQLDLRAQVYAKWSDGFVGWQDTLVDYKSTSRQDEGSGIYVESWLPQLTAYAFAEETVEYEAYEDGDRVKALEVGTGPWTPPERIAVVHLRGDEEATFYELPLDRENHDRFMDMARLYGWLKSLPKAPKVAEPVQ